MKPSAHPLSPGLAALLLIGCADLALESDRIPTELEILHDGGTVGVDETLQLEVVVLDQHGEEMRVPSWAPPTTWVTSDRRVAEVSGDGLVTTLRGGPVFVQANLGALEGTVRLRVNPNQVVLAAPAIHLTQAAQTTRGLVHLIAGRPALLRVFVTGDEISFFEPSVRVTLYQGDTEIFGQVLTPTTDYTPRSVLEGQLDVSYNVFIPGEVIQRDVTMVVELDPEGLVPLAPGSRTRYPAEGTQRLRVVDPPLFRQIMVPTISTQSPDSSVFDWTGGLTPESPQVRLAKTLMPVGAMELEIHETFTTSANLGTENGWGQWIRETRVLYQQEGRRGYYYGVVTVSGAAYGGLGYVGYPVSVGLASAGIYAHELGHNMNLWHAPCGGAGGPDPNYPYPGGGIGIWGYDIHEHQLRDPEQYVDVMGYCGPDWISDYHFSRATLHRLDGDGGVQLDGGTAVAGGRDRDEMLVVWGSVRDGQVQLDPAFVVDGPPVLPEAGGAYRVEGLGTDGNIEFSLSFTPTPLEFGGGSFVFFVPWESDWADSLDRMVLSGPEGEYTLTHSGSPPMAVVTDPSTGRIQAIIRDWDGGALPDEGTATVSVTRGIPDGPR